MEGSRKKRNITITSVIVCVCLAGAAGAAAVTMSNRNPLSKGLLNLAQEVMALEEELGKHFWTNAVNRIGSENIQAEYSLNVGGIPELQNITVGFDGTVRRDMERQLFETDTAWSVANTGLGEVSAFGTEKELYIQAPSIWGGSVVLDTEDVSGQWDSSRLRTQLQKLTGEELGIGQRIDARLFQSFSAEPFSAADFLRENSEALRELYENMEVLELKKARKTGMLDEDQAEGLGGYELRNAEGDLLETVCYLVVLQGEDLGKIFSGVYGDVRLAVYLDEEDRIVRICTLPEERLSTEAGEVEFALNLAGEQTTLDRLEVEISYAGDGGVFFSDLSDEMGGNGERMLLATLSDETGESGESIPLIAPEKAGEGEGKRALGLSGGLEAGCSVVIERDIEEAGTCYIEGDCFADFGEKVWKFSLEGSLQGERTDKGEEVFVDLESLVCKLEDRTICRLSGEAKFLPLSEDIRMPEGKEYRINEMNDLETVVFLAECVENVYRNYAGYIKLLQ